MLGLIVLKLKVSQQFLQVSHYQNLADVLEFL